MFATHPAKKIEGYLISDIPNERGFYPKELKTEIDKKFGPLYVEPRFATDRGGSYKESIAGMKRDFALLEHLVDRYNPDFVHMSISCTDGIQHFFWGDMIRADSKYSSFIENAWIEVDKLMNSLLLFYKSQLNINLSMQLH